MSGAVWAGLKASQWAVGAKIALAAAGGAVAGGIQSGTVEGAAWGAFSAGVFFGIGQGLAGAPWAQGDFLGSKLSGAGFAVKTVSHGLAGGTISHLQGGKFGHGFASAAGSAATAPLVDAASANVVRGAVVTTLVGGTLSRLSGGKFANGALTAAMSYAFNEIASSARRAAQERGEKELRPFESIFDPDHTYYHRYSIGPTALCSISNAGCTIGAISPLVGEQSVPFIVAYAGPGSYELPYGFGWDPIDHWVPRTGVWINDTRVGHRYDPGRVAHALYESRGVLWLYTVGVGVGSRGTENVLVGRQLFGAMHNNVRQAVDRQVNGPTATTRWRR